MKVNGDFIRVNPAGVDGVDRVGGAKPEPEQVQAERVIETEGFIQMGNGPNDPDGKQIGTMRDSSMNVIADVGTFERLAERCRICKHFNQAWWANVRKSMTDGNDANGALRENEVRAALMERGLGSLDVAADDLDVEKAMSSLGVCNAYSSIGNEMIVHPEATCPEYEAPSVPGGPPGLPLHRMFEHKDKQSAIRANAQRDALLRAASKGRK